MLPQTGGLAQRESTHGSGSRLQPTLAAAKGIGLGTGRLLAGTVSAARQGPATAIRTCEGIVKNKHMSVDADLKAGLILEDLVQQLADAVVDYRFAGGSHKFRIHRGDITYQVDFPERVLLEHQIRDLEKVVLQIVARLLKVGAPRRITIGNDGVGHRALATR